MLIFLNNVLTLGFTYLGPTLLGGKGRHGVVEMHGLKGAASRCLAHIHETCPSLCQSTSEAGSGPPWGHNRALEFGQGQYYLPVEAHGGMFEAAAKYPKVTCATKPVGSSSSFFDTKDPSSYRAGANDGHSPLRIKHFVSTPPAS